MPPRAPGQRKPASPGDRADRGRRGGAGRDGRDRRPCHPAAVVTAAATAAREALARTRDQLDVLAASGVVDAGAAGLCVLLDALAAAITGARPDVFAVPAAAAPLPSAGPASGDFGYEVTYLLEAPQEAVGVLRNGSTRWGTPWSWSAARTCGTCTCTSPTRARPSRRD